MPVRDGVGRHLVHGDQEVGQPFGGDAAAQGLSGGEVTHVGQVGQAEGDLGRDGPRAEASVTGRREAARTSAVLFHP
nr:hypothetical protein GCM10020093_001300 [Planobispora longispora]